MTHTSESTDRPGDGSEKQVRTYLVDGNWVAADSGGWLPGSYPSEGMAREAAALAATDYRKLANWWGDLLAPGVAAELRRPRAVRFENCRAYWDPPRHVDTYDNSDDGNSTPPPRQHSITFGDWMPCSEEDGGSIWNGPNGNYADSSEGVIAQPKPDVMALPVVENTIARLERVIAEAREILREYDEATGFQRFMAWLNGGLTRRYLIDHIARMEADLKWVKAGPAGDQARDSFRAETDGQAVDRLSEEVRKL